MSDMVLQRSIGELVDERVFSSSLSWTAGGAADSATWTGVTIDRWSFSAGSPPLSVDGLVAYDATLASGKTLSLYWDLQEGPDGVNFSDYATEAATVIATGPSGGARVTGVARLVAPSANKPTGTPGVDLRDARRYLRLNLVPHLSAAGTDTAVIFAAGVFAGFEFLPAPLV